MPLPVPTATNDSKHPPVTWSVPEWLRWGGPAVAVTALALYVATYLRWPDLAQQVDVLVYRFGATRVLDRVDLYSIGMTGNPRTMLFDYSPFAALCFIPLGPLSTFSVQALTLVVNIILVAYVVHRTLKWLGMTPAAGLLSTTALLFGLLLWLEPVRLTIQLGQINVAILAVVIADLLPGRRRRWAGVGLGLVAGIKLTPAIFIAWLVLIGRLRAAAVAASTLVGTVVLGFVLLPNASRFFWLDKGFHDVSRISSDLVANTSLQGLFVRLQISGVIATAAVILVAAAGLVVAALAWRRDQAVLSIAIVGMTSCAVSPFSWSHHWVWFLLLVIHLAYQGYALWHRISVWTTWTLWAVLAGWYISFGRSPEAGLLSLRHPGWWDRLMPSSYIAVYLAVLLCTAMWLRRSAQFRSSPSLEAATIRAAVPA
jgi:alpha-1,2-mannosyltransferase